METMKGSRHRSKGGGLGVLLRRLSGRGESKLSLSPNPQEMTMRRRMKMRKSVK
jgi:hypothetical protein